MLRGLGVFFTISLIVFMVGCGEKKQAAEDTDTLSSMDMPADMGTETSHAVNTNVLPVAPASVPAAITAPVDKTVDTLSMKPTSKEIQTALKNAGFYQGAIDGKIGPKTKKALEMFQKTNSLTADGKVGQKTWKALRAYLTNNAPSSSASTVPVQQ